MSRRSGNCLRCCLVVFAVISALAVCGPALYWRFKKSIKLGASKPSCPPCICDCPPPLSLLKIAPGITPSLLFLSVLFGCFCFLDGVKFCFWWLCINSSEIKRYPFHEFVFLIRCRGWFLIRSSFFSLFVIGLVWETETNSGLDLFLLFCFDYVLDCMRLRGAQFVDLEFELFYLAFWNSFHGVISCSVFIHCIFITVKLRGTLYCHFEIFICCKFQTGFQFGNFFFLSIWV